MNKAALTKFRLPDVPGVYFFIGTNRQVLYVGRATSLRDRVRSYFANDLLHTRGKHIVDMVTLAKSVRVRKTDSVLEAVILEASLIKKHMPKYNTDEKDDKSWNFVAVTNEEFPRVITIRERPIVLKERGARKEYKALFGPFTRGGALVEALKLIRRIFPFRDSCTPRAGKACFNRQIGLCPGVCTGEISRQDYAERIREIIMLFSGKKRALAARLKRLMRESAKQFAFEKAGEYRNALFALEHIRDVALIKDEVKEVSRKSAGTRRKEFRVEAYDVAHISGKFTVGVMTVVLDGRPAPSSYRKFKIRTESEKNDDLLHLEEVLRRRFAHAEWTMPDLVVIDGGALQKRRAEDVLRDLKKEIPVVSVVKDERHKPKGIMGNRELAESYRRSVLIGNAEAHRFAVAYHRTLRDRIGASHR